MRRRGDCCVPEDADRYKEGKSAESHQGQARQAQVAAYVEANEPCTYPGTDSVKHMDSAPNLNQPHLKQVRLLFCEYAPIDSGQTNDIPMLHIFPRLNARGGQFGWL